MSLAKNLRLGASMLEPIGLASLLLLAGPAHAGTIRGDCPADTGAIGSFAASLGPIFASLPAAPDRPVPYVLLPVADDAAVRPSPPGTLPDVTPARRWRPGKDGVLSGVEANAIINGVYQRQDEELGRYLGGPALSTFVSLAKYGSREAGTQIRDMEALMSAEETLSAFRLSPGRNFGAFAAMARVLASYQSLERGFAVMKVAARHSGDGPMPLRVYRFSKEMGQVPTTLRDALVMGNTEIYRRIATSVQIFLDVENAGGDGVAALRQAAATGRIDDRMGYIVQAFEKYREARDLGRAAAKDGLSPARRETLLARRRQDVLDANVLLATQEQAYPVESAAVWGDSRVRELMVEISPTMTLTLGGGEELRLLQQGGSWTDFATRMGFREVAGDASLPANALAVVFPNDPSAKTRWFVPDPRQHGTIYDIMTNNLDGERGARQRNNKPRPIEPAYVFEKR